MHDLIKKIFKKEGIESITELSMEEKNKYEAWQRVLLKEKVDIEEVETFCKGSIKAIEAQFRNPESNKDLLAVQHVIYNDILGVISSPLVEREQLILELKQLIKNEQT